VSIEDKAGNVGPASDPIHFIVDTSGNGISISHVVDDEGVQGNLASGSHTDDTTPTVVGRATPGSIVKVYVDGKLVDSVIADPTTGNGSTPSTRRCPLMARIRSPRPKIPVRVKAHQRPRLN
jgi:hypothetical protein